MTNVWKQQTALIVGGSAGIGKAMAEELAGQGARVIISARDPDRLAACQDELAHKQLSVEVISADIEVQSDVDRLIREVQSRYGVLHLLANCAGRSMRGTIESTTIEQHEQLWRLNFLGLVRTTLAAIPLLQQTHGTVVNIGSLAGRIAAPHLGAYPCSKFPVTAFSQQLRLELAGTIHVLLVLPGPVARFDSAYRYRDQSSGVPPSAAGPGGGAKLKLIDPNELARRIRRACERRQVELVVPGYARILLALAAVSPKLADRILRRMTGNDKS